MSVSEPSPRPSELSIFLGRWKAEGTSYGGTDQSAGTDPRANGVPWVSEHHAYWYTGDYFLVQDERARPGGETFDTLWVGRDRESGRLFARTFENHGFYRNYSLERDGHCWTISGETERATIIFSDDGRTQRIAWEWKPEDRWLPLCDRTATKID